MGGVEPEAIACGGYKRCAQLAGESEELLAVEDTTTVSYGHEGSRELGDVGGKERSKKRGFMVHSVILLEECQRRSKSTPLAGVKMHHLMRFSPALAVVPVVHRRDARCFV